MAMHWVGWLTIGAWVACGCGESGGSEPANDGEVAASSSTTSSTNLEGTATTSTATTTDGAGSGASTDQGSTSSSSTAAEGGAGGSGGAPSETDPDVSGAGGSGGTLGADVDEGADTPLPEGWREVNGVVNIVDELAAEEVEAYLTYSGQADVRPTLGYTTKLFFEQYVDEYDFLFLASDQRYDGGPAAAFQTVRRPYIPGTGIDEPFVDYTYEGYSRLRGAIGINNPGEGFLPPLFHETLHYWAVDFDPSFGFGSGLDYQDPSHWGYTSVHGQLGGFDETTLECATPAGQGPDECMPEDNGRFRYLLGSFAPNVNNKDYAPLELYLMGLIPLEEVPPVYLLLQDAEFVDFDDMTGQITIEASGISEILMDDIVARHGERELASAEERAFKSAFAIVSRQPVSDEMMDIVAVWAEVFGKRPREDYSWTSFEEKALGLATMDTTLGRRRTPDDPLPTEPMLGELAIDCDIYAQDCPEHMTCIGDLEPYCAAHGGVAEGDPCYATNDCLPGLTCIGSTEDDGFVCTPYCNLNDAAEKACSTLCPTGTVSLVDPESLEEGPAFCLPGYGPACDPLASDCPDGQACYGAFEPSCSVAGDVPVGSPCTVGGEACEPGATCLGFDDVGAYCVAFCDPDGLVADKACDTLCERGEVTAGESTVCAPPSE